MSRHQRAPASTGYSPARPRTRSTLQQASPRKFPLLAPRLILVTTAVTICSALNAEISISSLPFRADKPGERYRVTADLTIGSRNGITVSADNITIDGSSKTITYATAGIGAAVWIKNATNVEIHDLTFRQGAFDGGGWPYVHAIGGRGNDLNFHHCTFHLIAATNASDIFGVAVSTSASGSELSYSTLNITGANRMKAVNVGQWKVHHNTVTITDLKYTKAYSRIFNVGSNGEYYDNTITVDSGSQYVNLFVGWRKDNVTIHDNTIRFASRHGRIILMDEGCDNWKVYNNLITVTSQNAGGEVTYVVRIRSLPTSQNGGSGSHNHEIYNNTINAEHARKTCGIAIGDGGVGCTGIRIHHNIIKTPYRALHFYGSPTSDIDIFCNEITQAGTAFYFRGAKHADVVISHNTITGRQPLVRSVNDLTGTGAVRFCESGGVNSVSDLQVASAADFVFSGSPCQDGEGGCGKIGAPQSATPTAAAR